MSRFVSWYLVELDGLLRGRVTADRLHELLSEVELHLTEALQDRKSRGMADEEAELAVIEAMGSPERLAQRELGEGKWMQFGKNLSIGAALTMGVLWFILGFTPDSVFHSNVGGILVLGIALFWLGCLLSRTLVWRPILVAGALGVFSLSIHQGTQHVYVFEEEVQIRVAQSAVANFPATDELRFITVNSQTLPWDEERRAIMASELAKSPLARTMQRLPQAFVALSILMITVALVGFGLSKLPRARMHSWVRRRLA